MASLTPEILTDRHGVNVGFFYLRTKDASRYERKVSVFVKGPERYVWDGTAWSVLADWVVDAVVEDAIEEAVTACEAFNGKLS